MDSINTQNNYEQEVNLKDLLFVILHKWRIILVVSILLAILMGGAKGFLTYRSQNDPDAITQREEAYQLDLAQYENGLSSYEREIQNISDNIVNQQDYMEHSVLMNISPYNLYEAKVNLFVKTDYEIMPGMVYQNVDYTDSILQAYQYLITSASFLSEINPSKNLDIRYLQELIAVERGQLDSQMPLQAEMQVNSRSLTNLLTVRVRHQDQKKAEQLLNAILDKMDSLQRQIAKDIGEHSVTVLNTSCGNIVDMDLAKAQNEEEVRLTDLRNSLTDRETARNELSLPAAPSSSNLIALKSAVKYGILGGVLGGFMIVFLICVYFLMSDKLYSPKELRVRFGTKLLGTLPGTKNQKKNFIDLWLDRLEGRTVFESADSQYPLIAANIKNYAGEIETLLIAGCATSETVIQVADQLREHLPDMQIIPGGNILQNVNAIQKLSDCEGVVLVEQCNVSSYQSVELELEKICDLKKEMIGFVVYES